MSSSALRVSTCVLTLALAAGCGSTAPTAPDTSLTVAAAGAASPAPPPPPPSPVQTLGATTLPAGNPTCADLASAHGGSGAAWLETRLERAPGASDSFGDGVIAITLSNGNGIAFDWSATRPVDAILVKAGIAGNNLYLYAPEATSGTGLTTPGGLANITQITVCHDVELEVSETVAPTFTRDFDWTLAKSVDQPAVTLSPGAQATVNYTVVATRDAGTDSGWAVAGDITVRNPHPLAAATGVAVTGAISGYGAVTVSCPATSLDPLASMTCTYASVALSDGTSRTASAVATTATYGIARDEHATPVSFTTPTTVRDQTVAITDTFPAAGLSATPLSISGTFTYARTLLAASLTCGANVVSNTATLATDDGETRTASANVAATVDCGTGGGTTPTPPPPPPAPPAPAPVCAHGQGYWKTHSSKGPAKYDETWAILGEDTPFYKSGLTFYAQMQEAPKGGNAYVILAAQFIAARLNMLSGAASPGGSTLGAIDTFFKTYTPAEIGAMKGNDAVRKQALDWASALDDYNSGKLNVSACAS